MSLGIEQGISGEPPAAGEFEMGLWANGVHLRKALKVAGLSGRIAAAAAEPAQILPSIAPEQPLH